MKKKAIAVAFWVLAGLWLLVLLFANDLQGKRL